MLSDQTSTTENRYSISAKLPRELVNLFLSEICFSQMGSEIVTSSEKVRHFEYMLGPSHWVCVKFLFPKEFVTISGLN
jgi:hypothetical protein